MFQRTRTLASLLALAAAVACQDEPTTPSSLARHATPTIPSTPEALDLADGEIADATATWLAAGNVYSEVTGPVGIWLTFEASGSPTTGTGFVHYRNSLGQEFTGAVTCLDRRDNVAVLSGVITSANYATHDGTFYVAVQDNGEGDGATAPDRFRVLDYTYYFQGGCTNRAQAVFPAQVSQGNLQVLR